MWLILFFFWAAAAQAQPPVAGVSQTDADRVTLTYRAFLGRTPTTQELAYQLGAFRNGTPLPVVVESILKSPEAEAHAATVSEADRCAEHELQLQVSHYLLSVLSQRERAVAAVQPPVAPATFGCQVYCIGTCGGKVPSTYTRNVSGSGDTAAAAFSATTEACRAAIQNSCTGLTIHYLRLLTDTNGVTATSENACRAQ